LGSLKKTIKFGNLGKASKSKRRKDLFDLVYAIHFIEVKANIAYSPSD
tara:strand:- start:174 stop:317 length:144 start_codon:yes stop_codon:yes gene_type:complete